MIKHGANSTEQRWALPLAAALIAVFIILSFSESRLKSPTSDEPPHLASGLSYVATGIFRANRQHPPLLKELSGLSQLLGGIRWPRNPETDSFLHADAQLRVAPEWRIGNQIIAENGADKVMFWARLPFPLIAALLGVLIYAWGRQMLGSAAALGGLFLYVLDPTILAHSFLVTMDVGMAAFSFLLLAALWNYVQGPTRKGIIMCGLALGIALGAKFAALFMIPVAAALLLAALIWPEMPIPRGVSALSQPTPLTSMTAGGRTGSHPERTLQAGVRIGRNQPCPCGSGKKFKVCHGAGGVGGAVRSRSEALVRMGIGRIGALLAMCLVAVVVIQGLYFFQADVLAYYRGVKLVNADHNPNYPFFMAGELGGRFASYFAVAYFLKEPIASILLAGIGLVTLVRSQMGLLGKLFLLLPPAALFLGHTIWADDIGIRYIMAVLPFAHLLGGLGFTTLLEAPRYWLRGVGLLLGVWVIVATAGIYPDHLSYFNESACLLREPGLLGIDGGTRCGPQWLDDSNVDWGQGMKQLKTWLDQNEKGRTVRLSNPFRLPVEVYGATIETASPSELTGTPLPALYAISAHLVARVPFLEGSNGWLRRKPTRVVGHAWYIYDLAHEPITSR